jgi:UDP-glucose 4-epimerase
VNALPVAVVTGGAGFIGSHTVDLLVDRGFEVRIVDNLSGGHAKNIAHHVDTESPVSFFEEDIRYLSPDSEIFVDAKYVFHFAGIGDIVPSIERPAEYMDVNVQGTVRVLEAARHAKVSKFVYAASSSCYGLTEELPTTESAPIDPQYPYALSKLLGENAVHHWASVYGLPVNSIRIFNAYGPRSRTTGAYGAVFGVFLAQKLARQPLTVVGDGAQSRDFLFVRDIARAFLAAAETSHTGRIYNLGAGAPQSVNRLVELLGDDVTHIPDRPGEPRCTWADIALITEELGWTPTVSFEDGVAEMLTVIDDWRDAPVWDPTTIEEATRTWFGTLTKETP